jgi:uncharacterized protein YcbK (DUF882 family)
MQDIPFERRNPALGLNQGHKPAKLVTLVLFLAAAIGAVQFATPVMERRPFAMFMAKPIPQAEPSADAFGTSGEVLLKFSMPGREVEYPLAVHGDPAMLSYEWIRLGSTNATTVPRPLRGDKVVSPTAAGFYQLRLVRGDVRRIVDGLTLAVLVPFDRKEGGMLNGYRIGTYLGERITGRRTPPEGFLEIRQSDLGLQITKHLKVSDFLTHDSQDVWPKYAAVSPRLLDKLELVIAEISSWREGTDVSMTLDMDVHSGFRSPDHNRQVRRAARDSQHQYGDAADVTIDANGDGHISAMDSKMVGLAVEIVELKHPELVGGLGLYTSRRTGSYVHIDARGQRVRWRG